MSTTVTIENPNSTGRINSLVGLVGPGETREVSPEVAAALCDGVNFRRVESPEPRKLAPRKSS